MITIEEAAASFLSKKRIAVTGVSRDGKSHGSNIVYQRLRDRGYEVFAVNPNAPSRWRISPATRVSGVIAKRLTNHSSSSAASIRARASRTTGASCCSESAASAVFPVAEFARIPDEIPVPEVS